MPQMNEMSWLINSIFMLILMILTVLTMNFKLMMISKKFNSKKMNLMTFSMSI